MWNRQQLKEKAKISFRGNYWKCVLISLLFALVAGGAAISPATAASGHGHDDREDAQYYNYETGEDGSFTLVQPEPGKEEPDRIIRYAEDYPGSLVTMMVVFLGVLTVVFLIVFVIAVLLDIFICNPIEVGCSRFYFKNLEGQAQAKEAFFAFDHGYRNVVNVMFFRDLYTILWSLLFIIPGIVKGYEYQMIPYLLAENPQMTKEQAFAESRQMMSGNKWRAFVLDLSFLGWMILSTFTFGILNIFYVRPYMDATHAALYEALRYRTPDGGQTVGNIYMQNGQM